ncbi:MAG: hypothetical protein ACJ0HV_00655 [Candidatus Pseudothioglobus sp.]
MRKFSFEGIVPLFATKAKGGWSILVPVSLVLGVVSDLMHPLAPFSSYLFMVSSLAAILLLIVIFSKEVANIPLIWGCMLAVATSVISGGVTLLQERTKGSSGVIVDTIPIVRQLQSSVGLIRDDIEDIKETGQETLEVIEEIAESNSEIVLTLADIRAGIQSISQSGGIIADATNLAEHYHNARVYSQRGDLDLALESYKKVFENKLQFVDPLLDVVTLTTQLYGIDGARIYLDNNLKPILIPELYWLARQKLAEKPIPELVNRLILNVPELVSGISEEKPITYPPLLAMLSTWGKAANTPNNTWLEKQATYYAYKAVTKSYRSGEFLSFYIDPIRGEQAAMSSGLMEKNYDNDEYMGFQFKSPVEVHFELIHPLSNYDYVFRNGSNAYNAPNLDLWAVDEAEYANRGTTEETLKIYREKYNKEFVVSFRAERLDDLIDPNYPIEYCLRKNQSENEVCFNLLDYFKPETTDRVGQVWFPHISTPPTYGAICVDSVSYTDIRGYRVKHEFIKVSYDDRSGYGVDSRNPGTSKLIEECAGDEFRQ